MHFLFPKAIISQKDSLQVSYLQAITIPFFPFISGRQLKFPRPAKAYAMNSCYKIVIYLQQKPFPHLVPTPTEPISHSAIFLRIYPVIFMLGTYGCHYFEANINILYNFSCKQASF